MVKAIADFKNIIYILSFDKNIVCNILKDFQKSNGADYLEKIIQYGIDIPRADHDYINKSLNRHFRHIVAKEAKKDKENKFDENPWEEDRWEQLYNVYLSKKLQTQRQIIRFKNSFSFTYPDLAGDVNPIDFLAIEALRMFNPEIFYEIAENPSIFTKCNASIYRAMSTEKIKQYFEEIIDNINEQDQVAVRNIITTILFPHLVRKECRTGCNTNNNICSSYHFYKYFRYYISKDQISHNKVKTDLKLLNGHEEIRNYLIENIEGDFKDRPKEFFEVVEDVIIDKVFKENPENVIKALISMEDKINEYYEKTDLSLAYIVKCKITSILIHSIYKFCGETQKSIDEKKEYIFNILEPEYEETTSLYIITNITYFFSRKNKLNSGKNIFFNENQIDTLEKTTISKIEDAIDSDKMPDNVNLVYILNKYSKFTDSAYKLDSYIRKITKSDNDLKKILLYLHLESLEYEDGDPYQNEHYQVFLNHLDIKRIEMLKSDDLSKDEKAAIERFLNNYEKYLKEIDN